MPKKKGFDEAVEAQISKQVVDEEYYISKMNRSLFFEEFEELVQLLDSERQAKDYDWMSDTRIPEFASRMLTQASIDVGQYFQTRDFVEVFIEHADDPKIKRNVASVQRLINTTLNRRDIYHYLKFVRAKNINNVFGEVVAWCHWIQHIKPQIVGRDREFVPTGEEDIFGNERYDVQEFNIIEDVAVVDKFDYTVLDPRCVFMDNSYTYSIQDKEWASILVEMTYKQLEMHEETAGYFNLDKLGEADEGKIGPPEETEVSQGTYNKESQFMKEMHPAKNKPYDILIRFGKAWAVIDKTDDDGYPEEISPGVDEYGDIKENAEYIETIITHALSGSSKILIGYQPTPYIDSQGDPYKPLIRGMCYLHPIRDEGVGDGKYAKEIQFAIDDTFNMSQDRVKLATIPTYKISHTAAEAEDDIFFEPGHGIRLPNVEDLQELKFSDNIQGAMIQMGILAQKLDQVTNIFPTTMGDLPGKASTTATAVAGAESRTNLRSNYKALTFEYTFLTDLYWMINQMTYRFAQPETGFKLMGELLYDFDPTLDYSYKPLSQSIETEHSKAAKLRNYLMMLQIASKIPHPDMARLLNEIVYEIFLLMGKEAEIIAKQYLDPNKPILQGGGAEGPGGGPDVMSSETSMLPASNQYGVGMSGAESGAREAAFG